MLLRKLNRSELEKLAESYGIVNINYIAHNIVTLGSDKYEVKAHKTVEELLEKCRGCDVFINEQNMLVGFAKTEEYLKPVESKRKWNPFKRK